MKQLASGTSRIKSFLSEKVKLTPAEIEEFLRAVQVRCIRKGELFIVQGKRAGYKAFLNRGCTQTYFYDSKGKRNVIFFSFEGAWQGDIESYHLNRPSRISIEALEDCEFLVITKPAFEKLRAKIPNLNRWYDFTAVHMYSSLFDKLMESKIRNVEDQYRYLVSTYPLLFQRVPLQSIADYLEIEPPSLSRLRRRIQQREKSQQRY